MLMSDSLGGNAKTLMFVNVSPTDFNIDETQNSLQYATRVRTIKVGCGRVHWAMCWGGRVWFHRVMHIYSYRAVCVSRIALSLPSLSSCHTHAPPSPLPPRAQNDATKNESNKDMVRLKKQVDYWKEQAGLPADKREWIDLVAVKDERQPSMDSVAE